MSHSADNTQLTPDQEMEEQIYYHVSMAVECCYLIAGDQAFDYISNMKPMREALHRYVAWLKAHESGAPHE